MTLDRNNYHMIDITKKVPTYRTAVAIGKIHVGEQAFNLIKKGQMPKGDPLKLAEIAGIMNIKRTADVLPLCHPLPLEHIDLITNFDENNYAVNVICSVTAFAKTGVEMEALNGVQTSLLAIYDIVKNIEPALTITDTRLIFKSGGKKQRWIHPEGIPQYAEHLIPHQ